MVAATLKAHSDYVQSSAPKHTIMKTAYRLAVTLVLGSLALSAPASAAPQRGEQTEARMDMQSGQVKSLRQIEAAVLPRMRGMQYLGPEYDPGAQIYRLKFISNDRVIFVDVDGRTGAVLSQR